MSQRKTHVDEDEVSKERARIQSSVRLRAGHTLSSGLEEEAGGQIIRAALGRPVEKKTTQSSTEVLTVSNSWGYCCTWHDVMTYLT